MTYSILSFFAAKIYYFGQNIQIGCPKKLFEQPIFYFDYFVTHSNPLHNTQSVRWDIFRLVAALEFVSVCIRRFVRAIALRCAFNSKVGILYLLPHRAQFFRRFSDRLLSFCTSSSGVMFLYRFYIIFAIGNSGYCKVRFTIKEVGN